MYCVGQKSNSTSMTRPVPSNIFLLKDFKTLVEKAVGFTGVRKRFVPKLYSYADYVLVKLYALSKDMSIEWASERLNTFLIKRIRKRNRLKLHLFSDGKRKRRLIPHQTDVDKFFRLLMPKEVHIIFGYILTALNLRIKKADLGGSKMRFLADNTKYPYYGKRNTTFEIGTLGLPGTRRCRMFQGHALNGCGMTLFTDFFSIEKGKYRAAPLGPSVD